MLPDVQLALRPGIVEFGWGHPHLPLLPHEAVAQAAAQALKSSWPQALSYGAPQGPGSLLEPLASWIGSHSNRYPSTADIQITGGVSQALDMLCTLLTRPGDVVLGEAPVYHLALSIFRDHGLTCVPVIGDADGMQPDAVRSALDEVGRTGRTPRFLYTVPTFGNPTGVNMPLPRRKAVVEMAAETGLTILEDDVYRSLWYDAPPPESLYELAPSGVVVRLGSFSKILAPGLRLGWIQATPDLVNRCMECGLLDSGGGVNHFTAHVVAAFLSLGLLDPHIATLRAAYTARRDALVAGLARYLPEGCEWYSPAGGFFVWALLPPGMNSKTLLPQAEAAGVSYLPGTLFYPNGVPAGEGERAMRLAFSLLPPDIMEEGVRRLGTLIRAAGGALATGG